MGQSSPGWPYAWSPFMDPTNSVVVNTGPVLGTQSGTWSASLPAGASSSHSWVDLVDPAGSDAGYVIPAGEVLAGSIDVYIDPADTVSATGLSPWANFGGNQHGILAQGNGVLIYRNGTGLLAPVGVVSPLTSGWHNLQVRVSQDSPNTLTSTYYVDGVLIPGISHTRTVGSSNLVSDFDVITFNATAATATATARFDNYVVQTIAVPEPTTLGLLAGVGLVALRRKSR